MIGSLVMDGPDRRSIDGVCLAASEKELDCSTSDGDDLAAVAALIGSRQKSQECL